MLTFPFADVSFRDVYHRVVFVQYPVHKFYDATQKEFPQEADAALCYVYVDTQAGLTFEVLAPARFADGYVYRDFDSRRVLNAAYKIRSGALDEADALIAMPADEQFYFDEYAEHIDIIHTYYSISDEYQQLRDDTSIDHLRHKYFPDDVMLRLLIEKQTEIVWAHLIEAEDDQSTIVELLNDPYADCGLQTGDLLVAFRAWDEGNDAVVLFSTPNLRLEDVEKNIVAPERQLGALTFRDMYRQLVIVKYSIAHYFEDNPDLGFPEDADATLCMGVVYHAYGLQLRAIAPARIADAHVYSNLADETLAKDIRIPREMLEAETEAYRIDEYLEAQLLEQMKPQFDHLLETDQDHPDYEELRADYTLDSLRHEFYPDDIQIDLVDAKGKSERVWARLEEKIADPPIYIAYLLNQPHSESFHLNIGNMVSASPHTFEDGDYILWSGPEAKLEGQETYDRKLTCARDLFYTFDIAQLGTLDEDGAPRDEYDHEAYIAADSIPAGLPLDATEHMLSYIFNKSFNTKFDGEKIHTLAERLQALWANEGLEENPAEFSLSD